MSRDEEDRTVAGEESPRETVGERLRRLRHERGLSQQQLTGAGLSTAQISRIESGDRRPSIRAIRRLAEELQVSPEYLETGRDMTAAEALELRLADSEIRIRLGERPGEVLGTLREIHADARRSGNTVLRVRTLVDLSLVAANEGRYSEAASQLEQAIETGEVHPATHMHVYDALARAYWFLDDYERMARLMESCLLQLEGCPAEETAVARRTYMTHLSYALSELGEFDRARELLVEMREEEDESSDPYIRARLCWSFARLSTSEGRLPTALEYARRSIALLEASEDNVHKGRAHLLCAIIFNLDEQAEEAMSQLAFAEKLLDAHVDPLDRGQLRAEQAKALADLGEPERALAYAREAVSLLERDPDHLGGAWHALAKALASRGDVAGACDYYQKAVERIESDRGGWREAVQACRGWALVLREAGRRDEAAAALGRAAAIARRATSKAATRKTP
jgi:transcriptional regulator with XRE-family HTH domain